MKQRCPDSILLGKAVLQNYKIAFTIFSPVRKCGCADIVPSQGDEVWGLLYEISSDDLAKSDKAEGHPINYRRFQIQVKDDQQKEHIVETYEVATKQGEFLEPSKHYLGLMQEAALTFNFPETYQSLLSNLKTLD